MVQGYTASIKPARSVRTLSVQGSNRLSTKHAVLRQLMQERDAMINSGLPAVSSSAAFRGK